MCGRWLREQLKKAEQAGERILVTGHHQAGPGAVRNTHAAWNWPGVLPAFPGSISCLPLPVSLFYETVRFGCASLCADVVPCLLGSILWLPPSLHLSCVNVFFEGVLPHELWCFVCTSSVSLRYSFRGKFVLDSQVHIQSCVLVRLPA
jgi:hypothetical protein